MLFGLLKKVFFCSSSKSNLETEIERKTRSNAKSLGTDLVEADYFCSCCEECAKYRGRWFSISGRDSRFPKKPAKYKCTCAGLRYYPTIYGVSTPGVESILGRRINIIQFSNRPFVDDRTAQERENHRQFMEQRLETERKEKDRKEYTEICDKLPEVAPKSFGAYRKMKKADTENFKNLKKMATEAGIRIKIYK